MRKAGFSLVELIVASGISTIVALGSGAVMVNAVKTEQHGQAVADAARAGEVLKRSVFANSQGGPTDCSNALEIPSGFNGGNFTSTDGLALRIQGLPAFNGNVEAGQMTPFGLIESFKIIGADDVAEFVDISGNDVYEGAVYLNIRKGPSYPVTPVYLGTMGIRVDDAGDMQGCVSTGESDADLPVCTPMIADAEGGDTGPRGNCVVGQGSGNGGGEYAAGEPDYGDCPDGQIRVWIEPPGLTQAGNNTDASQNNNAPAVGSCRDITPNLHCECTTAGCNGGPGSVLGGLKGMGNQGAFECDPLPDARNIIIGDAIVGTPTPTLFPLPTPSPKPAEDPYTPPPAGQFATPTPTATPTPPPPPPTATQTCGDVVGRGDCIEFCEGEYFGGYGGGGCTSYCPAVTPCPTPVNPQPTPTVSIAPTPTPFVAPSGPLPVNGECLCNGYIISNGSYCGACFQEFEYERDLWDRGYIYRDRSNSFRCTDGSLRRLAFQNGNSGPCPSTYPDGSPFGAGGISYEYW